MIAPYGSQLWQGSGYGIDHAYLGNVLADDECNVIVASGDLCGQPEAKHVAAERNAQS